jgi:hypothetical protein
VPPALTTARTTSDSQCAASQAQIPDYHREFMSQAELVRHHLIEVGEPEILGVDAPDDSVGAAAIFTAAFSRAATRHRSFS